MLLNLKANVFDCNDLVTPSAIIRVTPALNFITHRPDGEA